MHECLCSTSSIEEPILIQNGTSVLTEMRGSQLQHVGELERGPKAYGQLGHEEIG